MNTRVYSKRDFEYCKFNTKEEAIDWINSKPNRMKYDKELIVE